MFSQIARMVRGSVLSGRNSRRSSVLSKAVGAAVEGLEDRRLLSAAYELKSTFENSEWDVSGYGAAVAIRGDLLVVGAPSANGGVGAAFLYNTSTKALVAPLLPAGGNPFMMFGATISFVGDNLIAIGAMGTDVTVGDTTYPLAGAVYLYNTDGSPAGVLTSPDLEQGDSFAFGNAVAGMDNGTQVVVKGRRMDQVFEDPDTHEWSYVPVEDSVYVMNVSGTLAGTLTQPAGATEDFGVAIATSGDQILVGDPWSDQAALYSLADLATPTVYWGDPGSQFGFAVAINGSTIAIGAPGLDSVVVIGAASPLTGTAGEAFGMALAISDSDIIVGAAFANGGAGAAYAFDRADFSMQVLSPALSEAYDGYGEAVAASGSTVAVGAPGDWLETRPTYDEFGNPVGEESRVGTVSLFSAATIVVIDEPSASVDADGILQVVGTTGANGISIAPATGGIEVFIDGVSFGVFNPANGVVLSGGDGADTLHVAGSIAASVTLIGGDGDDSLKGGGGDDVLIGGDGDDLLGGGSGRDLMIGGNGADRLVGNADDDILVAGSTLHDHDPVKLAEIMAIWSDASKSFATRVTMIRDQYGLLNDVTVADDADADILTGSSGTDWFIFSDAYDRTTDLKSFELEYALDLAFLVD